MIVAKNNGAKGIIFVSQVEDEELYPLICLWFKNDDSPAIILSKSRANKYLKELVGL